MEIDTYRYLLSALIQVFGAIIAITAVFLTFKYSLNRDKLKSIKNKLWFNLWCDLEENKLLGLLELRKTIRAKGNPVEYVMTLDENQFDLMITDTINNVKQAIDYHKSEANKEKISGNWKKRHKNGAELKTELLQKIKFNHKVYKSTRTSFGSFQTIAIRLMIIPAVLSIFYAVALWFADITCKLMTLHIGALAAVLLAIYGFYKIISQAASIIKD